MQGYGKIFSPLFRPEAGDVYAFAQDNSNAYFATPQMTRRVREHFGCEVTPGALLYRGVDTGHLDPNVLRVR